MIIPDIGPSGDHKSVETILFEPRPNFMVNMWLNNLESGSSRNSQSTNELYTLDEDHLQKINFIRRKLNMVELKDVPESKEKGDTLGTVGNIREVTDFEACKKCLEEEETTMFPQNRPSLSLISETSKISLESEVAYKPPVKKPCLHSMPPTTASSVRSHTTNRVKTKINEIPKINLEPECIENKSIQCTSKDTDTSHSSGFPKTQCYQRTDADLTEVEVYVEPEIILKQPEISKRSNKNCITFLPIKNEEITSSEKSNRNGFYDDIVSNCSFSFAQPPTPSHDSFFKSRKRQRKRRTKKKEKTVVEGVNLEKSSIEVRRMFPSSSDTSEAFGEVETDQIPALRSKKFDKTLMAGLDVPSKVVKSIKFPLISKLSWLILNENSKKEKEDEIEEYTFEDDISSVKSNVPRRNSYVRVGTEYSTYRKAAEELLTINQSRTDDMKQHEVCLPKNSTQKSPNKYALKKRQSVDYNFYSMDLPQSRTCDVLRLNEETEDESDSDCLRAIENCCCIRRIFKRRNFNFFSN